jgi:hypothetical protein
MPLGYGKMQNVVYDWLEQHGRSATTTEVAKVFGKNTKWTYKILVSLEDTFRIAAGTGKPIRWWILRQKAGEP